jgi:guanine deaminase
MSLLKHTPSPSFLQLHLYNSFVTVTLLDNILILESNLNPLYKIILCDFINPINDKKCELTLSGAIVLKRYTWGYKIIEKGSESLIMQKYSSKKSLEVLDKMGQLALPGFFDMHFHWVQDDVRLMPKDNLLEWLSKYTWPYEAKFKDRKYSNNKAMLFSKELLAVGTLGGACYASIHGHTVDHALKYFLGDYTVGNVLMTMNSPEYLTQTEKNAVSLIEKKSEKFKRLYAMTPRFAPTTSPEVMKKGGVFARKNKSFIQTHLSETENEIDYVLSLYKEIPGFEDVKTYTEIYDRCKLLGPQTIMGHGIHLSDVELKVISKTKTKIAHCPTSNAPHREKGLGSGLFDFRKVEKKKIDWALASDIGGGPFLSMFDVMRSFVQQNGKKKIKEATFIKALYRATLKGAEILGKDKKVGNLDAGKEANLIFVDTPKLKDKDSVEEVLKKIVLSKKTKREQYDTLVNSTFYRGEVVFTK